MVNFSEKNGWVKGYTGITEKYNEVLTENLSDGDGISSITGKRALACGSFQSIKSNGIHYTHVNSISSLIPKGLNMNGILSVTSYTGLSKRTVLRDLDKGLPHFETFRRLYFCPNSLYSWWKENRTETAETFRQKWNQANPDNPIVFEIS